MQRLFLAVYPSEEAVEALVHAQERLREAMPRSRVRWVPPEQIHLTLHFFGDVEASARDALVGRLDASAHAGPFALRLTQLGAFPDKKDPRILWAGTTLPTELLSLHARTGRAVVQAGLALDARPFVPHLTLGRVAVRSETSAARWPSIDPIAFAVNRFALVRSEQADDVVRYDVLRTFSLDG